MEDILTDLAIRLDAELDALLPLHQDRALRRALRHHPDPRLREISRQFDDGTLNAYDLVASASYRAALNDGIRGLQTTARTLLPSLLARLPGPKTYG